MKRFAIIIALIVAFAAPLKAQMSAACPVSDEVLSYAFAPNYTPGDAASANKVYAPDMSSVINNQIKIGTGLLITGGALTATGAALYGSAWALMGDNSGAASWLAISGLTCGVLSVGFYIGGSIIYCSGKKAQKAYCSTLEVTPSGLALRF